MNQDNFKNFLIRIERKKTSTASQYATAIDKLSVHYSQHKGLKINIFDITDLKDLNTIVELYESSGRYSEYGNLGHGTNRAAIKALFRYRENPNIENHSEPYKDPNQNTNTLRIGILVKEYIQKIFHYCILEEPNELSRLMDKDYSKRVFNINFPFCKELSQLTEDELVRYWKIDYKVQNKILRVCSQWVIDSKGLFLAYLMSKNIISEQEYYKYKNIVKKGNTIRNPSSYKNIDIKKTSEIVRKSNIIEKKEQITKFDETDSDLFFDEKLRAEATEMARYYEVFYSLERSIRSLIVEVMEKKYGKLWWETKVDYRVRENVKRNLEYELDTPHTKRSEQKIDYATFGDLRKIINTNWADFQSKFNRNMSSVNEILIDLNRIRVPIAHSTPLARREVQRLELRIGDWFDHLKD